MEAGNGCVQADPRSRRENPSWALEPARLGDVHRQPGRRADRRAAAVRGRAVDILRAAVSDGRLTLAELEDRVGAALSARTRTELAALVADLFAVRPAARPPSRRAIIQSLIDRRGSPLTANVG